MDGYSIGVDLGTSNTVAMLRGPDGRARPLLFDGQPTLPSAVYLDERGQLHVGRDAQRLAQLDPARYEPNPKRRIDEPVVLLGPAEVPVVDLLAATLRRIADAAVETVGFLPRAVLTCPAAWGPVRRDTLVRAVALAGWPPVVLVPEPVAAARYFAGTLRRPVPVGACLAVFDFGGGTVDIAVVRNDGPEHGFTVLGSGGLEDVGGLDLDAALVAHLGTVLARVAPEAWRALADPRTPADRRARRLFWEDVRGAKEMLSRTTSAPVPVPGLDQAVHLTRAELEAVAAGPLGRAVARARAVITGCGLDPAQLAGLFLVGGSSRVPMVGRLLHAELGIAPTVLEQPELPVAEGALAELPPPVDHAAEAVVERVTGPLVTRKRVFWGVSGLALVAALVVGLVLVLPGPYREVSFVAEFGKPVLVARTGQSSDAAQATIVGDTAYLASVHDKKFQVTAYDLKNKREKWSRGDALPDIERTGWIAAWPGAVVAFADRSDSSKPNLVAAYDPRTRALLWRAEFENGARYFPYPTYVVQVEPKAGKIWKIDYRTGVRTGGLDFQAGDLAVAAGTPRSYVDASGGTSAPLSDARIVRILPGTRRAQVIDTSTMKVLREADNVGGDDHYLAYDGRLYVATANRGYQLYAYELDTMAAPATLYRETDTARRVTVLEVCAARVCLLDERDGGEKSARLVTVGLKGDHWTKDLPGARRILPVGDRILVVDDSGSGEDLWTALYDDEGALIGGRQVSWQPARLTDGSVLLFDRARSGSVQDLNVYGMSARSGKRSYLGKIGVRNEGCGVSAEYLVCPREKDFAIYRLAS
ncbi:Hsp70 family protein [Longispora sp. K20-0274]|uniref:Hsp70 family protein n=1 Tax=Longispora sp. K20-0274 TaxID=3088255 RepID=UPI00399C0CB9